MNRIHLPRSYRCSPYYPDSFLVGFQGDSQQMYSKRNGDKNVASSAERTTAMNIEQPTAGQHYPYGQFCVRCRAHEGYYFDKCTVRACERGDAA